MKYTILVNQFCWERNNFKSLDLVDLALFDFIKDFMSSGRPQQMIHNNNVYYWISPQYVIEEMPILGITSTRSVNRRIDNLIEAKLLERCPNNQSEQKTYIRAGERYNQYLCYQEGDETQMSPLGQECPSTWTQMSNNKTINNNNTIYKKEIYKERNLPLKDKENEVHEKEKEKSSAKRERELVFPYNSDRFMELWKGCLQLKKWKDKTTHSLQLSLDKLAKVSESDAIQALECTLECGYQGVFTNKYAQIAKAPTKQPWEQMGISREEYNNLMQR